MESQAWLDAVEAAKQNAAAIVNAGGEIFYVTDANWESLRQMLVDNNISKDLWTNYSIWVSAIMGARADGTLQNRPTREEAARIREAEDRKAGQTRYRKDSDSKPEQFDDIKTPMEQMTKLLRGEKTEEAKPEEKLVVWPSYDLDLNNIGPADAKLIKALTSEQYKRWLATKREKDRADAQAAAKFNPNNVRLIGDPRG